MANPIITPVENGSVFKYGSIFLDRTVEIPIGGTMLEGTVLGVLTDVGEANQGSFAGFDTTLTSGAEVPVAVLGQTIVNESAVVVALKANVRVCFKGEVDGDNLIFAGADTLTTLVDGLRVEDILAGKGIITQDLQELTYLDNN